MRIGKINFMFLSIVIWYHRTYLANILSAILLPDNVGTYSIFHSSREFTMLDVRFNSFNFFVLFTFSGTKDIQTETRLTYKGKNLFFPLLPPFQRILFMSPKTVNIAIAGTYNCLQLSTTKMLSFLNTNPHIH